MSRRSDPVVDWHAGRISSEELAVELGDELLCGLNELHQAQRRNAGEVPGGVRRRLVEAAA